MDAYLDIETTGLSWEDDEITVIGLYLVDGNNARLVQLTGQDVTRDNLSHALKSVDTILTYNGTRFDLPFIEATLGLDLASQFNHRDLMYDCWQCNLYGGLKLVEQQLGISRKLKDIGGWDAVVLWQRYLDSGDGTALDTLLQYNKEDVVNLKTVRERVRAIRNR